jgi:hypothetical protein
MIGSGVFLMLFCGLVAVHPMSKIVVPIENK